MRHWASGAVALGIASALLALAPVVGAREFERDIVFECPCRAVFTPGGGAEDGGEVVLEFTVRSFRESRSAPMAVWLAPPDRARLLYRSFSSEWEAEAALPFVGGIAAMSAARQTVKVGFFKPDWATAALDDGLLVAQLLESPDDGVRFGFGIEVEGSGDFRDELLLWRAPDALSDGSIEFVDILTDSDGDGVGDVNEWIAAGWRPGSEPPAPNTAGDREAVPAAESEIDVLWLYHESQDSPEFVAEYRHAAKVASLWYEDSGTNIRLRPVGFVPVSVSHERDYIYPGDPAEVAGGEVAALAANHGADLVHLVYEKSFSFAGVFGWGGGGFSRFLATRDSAIRDGVQSYSGEPSIYVIAHELGHVLGLAHSVEEAGSDYGTWRHSRGHNLRPRGRPTSAALFKTVMAFSVSPNSAPTFSNALGCPHAAAACGLPRHHPQAADAVASLDAIRFQAAAVRQSKPDRDGDGFVDDVDARPDDPDAWSEDGAAETPARLFPDRRLCNSVALVLQVPCEDIRDDHLADLEKLELTADLCPAGLLRDKPPACNQNRPIWEFTGLERAVNLTTLRLTAFSNWGFDGGDDIVDLSPLSGLEKLEYLALTVGRGGVDLSPLRGLGNLWRLSISGPSWGPPAQVSGLAEAASSSLADSLTSIWLHGAAFPEGDIVHLRSFLRLSWLEMARAGISDTSMLANALKDLPLLSRLYLGDNLIRDISPLSGLERLQVLRLPRNEIADARPIGRLSNLRELDVSDNRLASASLLPALNRLGRLKSLDISDNPILGDALLQGLQPGDALASLAMRELAWADKPTALEAFRLRAGLEGLDVDAPDALHGDAAPAAEAAHLFLEHDDASGRHGFMRIVNNHDTGTDVRITGRDGGGRAFGPVFLSLGERQAIHLNSGDLERGNPAKGLSGGFLDGGDENEGDWRLKVGGPVSLEVLSYVRTADGFVTYMHDTAPMKWDGSRELLFFNPGSNNQQESRLRLVNDGTELETVAVSGIDDAGEDGESPVRVEVPAGHALELTAADLEGGDHHGIADGALGDGLGKWRLRVEASAGIAVMGLLETPSGHLVNLSAEPSGLGADGAVLLPLVLSASELASERPRQGFVRVVNRSDRSGCVAIRAIDHAGIEHGPVTLSIGPRQSRNFNSTDLEAGNADKGLSGGVGAASTGSWRLSLKAGCAGSADDIDFEALAYVRTGDGFVTSMHGRAPDVGKAPRVAFFNPGSNNRQESVLRLVNAGSNDARVAVTGTDDAGSSSDATVELTVPAGVSVDVSAGDLEGGGHPDITGGALGDGAGKWRLCVEADGDVTAMSVLETPTGHLTNMASPPVSFDCSSPGRGG